MPEKKLKEEKLRLEKKIQERTRALEEKTALLESVLQLSPVGIVAIDKTGHFILRNATAQDLAPGPEDGKPEDWEEDFGMLCADGQTPLPPEETPLMRSLNEGAEVENFEMFLRNAKHQAGIIISISSRPLKHDDGEIWGAICAFFDVTERKQLEESLQKAKAELEQRVAERTEELSRQIDAKEAIELQLRQANQQLKSRDWLHQGQLEILAQTQREQSLSELCNNTLTNIAKYCGADLGVLYLAAEQQLQFQTGYALPESIEQTPFAFGERLSGLAAASQQVQSTSLTETQIADAPKHLRIKNSFYEIVPRECLALPLTYNDQVIGVMELAFKDLVTKRQRRYLSLIAEPLALALKLKQSQTQIQKLLKSTQTQSLELQNRQEELEQSNTELEEQRSYLEEQREELKLLNNALKQSQQSLRQKAQDLEQASQYKSEFLANMSHELRTPLNSILILSQLLSQNKKQNLDAQQMESAETIYNSGHDLLKLIDDILDMAKIEAGHLSLHLEDFALQDLLDKLMRRFQPMFHNKGLKFQFEQDPQCPAKIHSDVNRIEQILSNFLANACKFTEQGQVTLRCQYLDGPTLRFSVEDSGPGIPQDKQEQVFSAFQQLDSSISRTYGGTGLGLSIASKLAEKLGGSLHLTSEVGQGSCFSFRLPLKASEPGAAPEPTAVSPPKASSALPKVLIVEDDNVFAEHLKELGEDAGFQCYHTELGKTGLNMARTLQPDAILLDLNLPDIHGIEFLKELRTTASTKHIPVQILSVENRESEAQALGVLGYIKKPLDNQNLSLLLEQIKHQVTHPLPRLLLIDDNTQQCQKLVRLLEKKATIFECAEIAEALQILQNEAIDGIIVNLTPEDTNSVDFLKALRQFEQREQRPVPPLIIYTAHPQTDQYEELTHFSKSIVIQGEKSQERLFDEVQLFLHEINQKKQLQQPPQSLYKAQSSEPAPPEQLNGQCILLVDDDMRNIYALRQFLLEHNAQVIVAKNGQEALDKLEQQQKIDLVLMDIMMPVMDGYEAIAAIRTRQAFAELPIIALTAKAMPQDQQKCLQIGANDYLTKPVQLDKLLQRVLHWLKQ